jgi:hypothetical protein
MMLQLGVLATLGRGVGQLFSPGTYLLDELIAHDLLDAPPPTHRSITHHSYPSDPRPSSSTTVGTLPPPPHSVTHTHTQSPTPTPLHPYTLPIHQVLRMVLPRVDYPSPLRLVPLRASRPPLGSPGGSNYPAPACSVKKNARVSSDRREPTSCDPSQPRTKRIRRRGRRPPWPRVVLRGSG